MIRQALLNATKILEENGVPDAKLDAEYLLASVLSSPRLLVLASSDIHLNDERLEQFLALVERRKTREPLQYILKEQSFMGLPFKVTEDVLIPRFDTEALCEQALFYAFDDAHVLDLCTGSGALAVSLKALNQTLHVTAVDISPKALDVAKENALNNGADVVFLQGDMFAPVQNSTFDVIVSNPPYINEQDMLTLQEEVKKEPVIALQGGKDGMDFYRIIAQQAKRHLTPNGVLLLEIGDGQQNDVRALLENQFNVSVLPDMNGFPRVVVAKLKGATYAF